MFGAASLPICVWSARALQQWSSAFWIRYAHRVLLARIAMASSGALLERLPRTMTASFPDWVEPMAATLTQERFTGPEWIFERKFDGIRLLAFKQGADVRLFSRNRLPQHIPAIAEAIAQPAGARRDPRRRGDLGRERSRTTCSTSCGSTAAT